MIESYSIDVEVRILPTFVEGGIVSTEDDFLRSASEQLRADLVSATVTNSITSPFQQFELVLQPRAVLGPGTTWADLIRPYTLVSLAFHRRGQSEDEARYPYPLTTTRPEPILVGLVDYVTVSEDYGHAAVSRSVRVSGRSLSAVLSDHRWWHHWFLAPDKEDATVAFENLPPDFRQYYESQVGQALKLKRDELSLAELGYFAIDPWLYSHAVDHPPVYALALTWDFFVRGSASRPGFLKLRFADGSTLADKLVFDTDAAATSWFDSTARLIRGMFPSQMPEASCWQMLQHFSEPPFVELFTDTFGSDLSDAKVHVICRKPPWAGHITADQLVGFSTGDRLPGPAVGQSLFDGEFGAWWERDRDTVAITARDVISRPLMRRGISGEMFSAYEVRPAISSAAGNQLGDRILERTIPPLLDEDPESPSYILRYGIRPKHHLSKYIPVLGAGTDDHVGDPQKHSLAYALLLRTWLHRLPEMWSGTYVLRGRTGLRAGRRLLDRTARREYYITSATHRVSFAPEPIYTTTVQVERGWDLQDGAA